METLLQVRCKEVAAQEPGAVEGGARKALGRLLDAHLYGEAGRQPLGYGCRGGTADTAGWPPGRSALVATGYRIKAFDAKASEARAVVEYDVVATVGAEEAAPVTRREEVAVEMVLTGQEWRMNQAALYVSVNTAQQAYQIQLARLTPDWFKQASQEQIAWWKRKSEAIRTLNLIEIDLAKKGVKDR